MNSIVRKEHFDLAHGIALVWARIPVSKDPYF